MPIPCDFHFKSVSSIRLLKILVRGIGREPDVVQWVAKKFSMLFEKCTTNTVSADAIVLFGDGCEQRGDFEDALAFDFVEGAGGVFAGALGEEDSFIGSEFSVVFA